MICLLALASLIGPPASFSEPPARFYVVQTANPYDPDGPKPGFILYGTPYPVAPKMYKDQRDLWEFGEYRDYRGLWIKYSGSGDGYPSLFPAHRAAPIE